MRLPVRANQFSGPTGLKPAFLFKPAVPFGPPARLQQDCFFRGAALMALMKNSNKVQGYQFA